MRRPITLALLLVAAGTLSAVAVTTPRKTDPDVYFAAKTEQAETGLKARLSAGTLKQVMLDFPEVGESREPCDAASGRRRSSAW